MKKLGADRSYRELCGEFICDGVKLLYEALNNDVEILAILTSSDIQFPLSLETRLYYTDHSLIDSLSPLKNAQEIMFTCKTPQQGKIDPAGTHILLDGVQDPGNVGTIIRTANAFGIKTVILTDGCADPYNPKTLRASMGAIFRQEICYMNMTELNELKGNGVRFIASTTGKGSKDISSVKIKDSLIAIGSEGHGLSQEVLLLCDEKVRIPIEPECESLNAAVAAGIIMWSAR